MWRLLFGSANCRIGALLLIAGTLNGCDWDASSGKSGSRTPEPDTTPPVVESDTTPPVVRAINPSDGSEGVSRTGVITAEFDEDIFADTVDEDSFSLARSSDGNIHSGTVDFDANSNTASFSPNTPLSMLEAYSATLGTEITDLSGNPLAAEYIWSFTAGDGAWTTVEKIGASGTGIGSARASQIAINAGGRAIAVWEQFESSRHKIWANHFDGTSWGEEAELIESDSGGVASTPQIALNTVGQALAVWVQFDGTQHNTWANQFDGSDWVEAQSLPSNSDDIEDTDGGTSDAEAPRVAINSDGHGIAVWQQFDGLRNKIWANRFNGIDWEDESKEVSNAGNASAPQVALDSNGRALAVWQQFDNSRNAIWANRFNGSEWEMAGSIHGDILGDASAPKIAFKPDGQVLTAWIQSDGSQDDIWANRFDGSTWGTAVSFETDNVGGASASALQVVLHDAGWAFAVWQQSDGVRSSIWVNRLDGSAWGKPEQLGADIAGSAFAPQIALDAEGRALVVWQQSDGLRSSIWANRFDGSAWGEAEPIEAGDARPASSPQIAFDADGRAIAVWQQPDGARDNIWARRFE
ncbi:Ig-like domain-containing protein [Marinobacter similis]|uniref:SbsA Ig-like domain-containing protein n=1 Tax=Marinobacter similis TaxID=1420916 RepID=W5YMI0_9GAMM|nr:Ig-like domain-containing protein [Marinobacter similis]AHI30316.1 hypothetical protein AU14_18635 [Marinobacter similis]